MTTPVKSRKSSCPDGWHPAGVVIPLVLTSRQVDYAKRAIGISRFIYNLCVKTHEFCRINRLPWPSWQDLYKEFNAIKRDEFPFVTEVAARTQEGAFMDFGRAIANWHNPNIKARCPTLRRKRITGKDSFRAASSVAQIKYEGKRRIRLPVIGSVKMAHTLPEGIPVEARIKYENGCWYISVTYWKPPAPSIEVSDDTREIAGAVDTGINPLAVESDGTVHDNPKAYYDMEKRLRRHQRAQSRRKRGGRRWWQSQRKIDRLYRRLDGIRHNALHQLTSSLVNKYQIVVAEDLNVVGLMKGNTPKAQADACSGEIKRQLVYKGKWRHTGIVLASQFYPSSKTCSFCKFVNAKLKRERTWTCPACGITHERNENAAVNLRELLALLAGSERMLREDSAWDGDEIIVSPVDEDGKALAWHIIVLCETFLYDRRTALLDALLEAFNEADCVLTAA